VGQDPELTEHLKVIESHLRSLDERLDHLMQGNAVAGIRTMREDLYGNAERGRAGLVEGMKVGDALGVKMEQRLKGQAWLLRVLLAAVVVLLAAQVPVLADILRLGVR